jgi:hypothetical protein
MNSPSSYAKPIRLTVFVADLKCYMCGAVCGSLESDHPFSSLPGSGALRLQRPGESEPAHIDNWRRLRCTRCGGPLFLDESEVITRRIDEYNWLEERPRRGRPPKRILEERRRERELLESQAA